MTRSEIKIARRSYVVGLDRIPMPDCERKHAHLYRGTFYNVGAPMCRLGWNRDDGTGFSIWRGDAGAGICKVCLRRAEKRLPPIEPADASGRHGRAARGGGER